MDPLLLGVKILPFILIDVIPPSGPDFQIADVEFLDKISLLLPRVPPALILLADIAVEFITVELFVSFIVINVLLQVTFTVELPT
jgi:hypothetical protein